MDQLSCFTAIGIFIAVIFLFVLVVMILSRRSVDTAIQFIPETTKLRPEQREMVMGGVDDSQLFDRRVLPHPSFRLDLYRRNNTVVFEGVTDAVFMMYQSISEQMQGPAVVICSRPINTPNQVPPELSQFSWYRLVYQIQDPGEYMWVRNLVAQIPPYVPLAAMELYLKPVAVNNYTAQSNERYVHPDVIMQ